MTEKEYKDACDKAYDDYQLALEKIRYDYAMSHNPYKVGDTIEDHIGKGIIRRLTVHFISTFYGSYPFMEYECDNLTRKGEINKREPVRVILQPKIKNA